MLSHAEAVDTVGDAAAHVRHPLWQGNAQQLERAIRNDQHSVSLAKGHDEAGAATGRPEHSLTQETKTKAEAISAAIACASLNVESRHKVSEPTSKPACLVGARAEDRGAGQLRRGAREQRGDAVVDQERSVVAGDRVAGNTLACVRPERRRPHRRRLQAAR